MYMDCSWDSLAQTHVSELGRRRNVPGKGKARRTSGYSAHPQPQPCSEIPFPVPGLSSAFRPGAKGSVACRISQNYGKGEAHGTPGLLGYFMVPASGTASAALRTKGWLG